MCDNIDHTSVIVDCLAAPHISCWHPISAAAGGHSASATDTLSSAHMRHHYLVPSSLIVCCCLPMRQLRE